MITETQIQAVAQRIVEGYAPDQVILFGSYAYGVPTEYSDLDLLVIKRDDETPVRERRQLLKQLLYTDLWMVDVDITPLTDTELEAAGRNRCRREYAALQRGRILHGPTTRSVALPADAPLSSEEKRIIQHLMTSAEQDLATAQLVMSQLDYYDMVARTNQAAAEKILKARLLSLRAALPSGHDLNILLSAIAQLEPVDLEVQRNAKLLAPFSTLFHDYFFTVAHPPTQQALYEAATFIYQTFAPGIRQSLT